MESLGDLGLNIKIDWQKVNKSLRKISTAVGKVSKTIASKIGSAMKSISRAALTATKKAISIFTNAFSKIVQIIKRAMIVSGVAITGFLVYSTKMAIEIEEIESLFDHSFGNMAKSVKEWSEEYSKSVKANKYDSLSFLSTMFNMTKSMGLTEEQATSTAKQIVELSNDLKSAYNLKGDIAFEKIRSGIAGESEPLKQLGILLDETTVKEYAYANGIAERGKVLTNQQKVLARLGALQKATVGIQGDMLRTLGSTQNRLRALTDGFKEFSVNMGKAIKNSESFKRLLTLIEGLAIKVKYAIADKLTKAISLLDEYFGKEKNRKKWMDGFKAIGKVIQIVIQVIKKLVAGIIKLGNSKTFLRSLYKVLEEVKEIIISLWGNIKKLVTSFKEFITDEKRVKKFVDDFKEMYDTVKSLISGFSSMAQTIFDLSDGITGFFKAGHEGAKKVIGRFIAVAAVIAIIKAAVIVATTKLIAFLNAPIVSTKQLIGRLRNLIDIIKGVSTAFGKWKFTPIKSLIQTFKTIAGWLKTIGGLFAGLFAGFLKAIGLVTWASSAMITTLSLISAALGWLFGKGIVAGINWLATKFEWLANLLDAIAEKAAKAWLFISKLWGGGIPDDPNAQKAADIRAQRNQQANIPTPSTLSNAYAQNGTGNKAMLAKMDALINAVQTQPQRQVQLERVRV